MIHEIRHIVGLLKDKSIWQWRHSFRQGSLDYWDETRRGEKIIEKRMVSIIFFCSFEHSHFRKIYRPWNWTQIGHFFEYFAIALLTLYVSTYVFLTVPTIVLQLFAKKERSRRLWFSLDGIFTKRSRVTQFQRVNKELRDTFKIQKMYSTLQGVYSNCPDVWQNQEVCLFCCDRGR